ncbi:MAG: hypothetical protein QM800_07400 [Paludibacter sp.]
MQTLLKAGAFLPSVDGQVLAATQAEAIRRTAGWISFMRYGGVG